MAENSNIEWTHHTFNPWIGCQKVGPGCDHCYAETWDARGLQGQASRWGAHAPRTRTSAANWRKPLAWGRAAKAAGVRHRVFCASLADVFDNHASILPEWRADLWSLIHATPHLDWMLLTKRPQNIAKFLPGMAMELGWGTPAWGDGWPNVWLGCTVVNQAEADRDIPKLLDVPARIHFLSMEPLLGRVVVDGLWPITVKRSGTIGPPRLLQPRIDLVIVGGESGPGARPMHPDWARSLRDQCVEAGVAFHFKQWGEWAPGTFVCDQEAEIYEGPALYCDQDDSNDDVSKYVGGVWHPDGHFCEFWTSLPDDVLDGRDIAAARRVGKKRAGRLLDGRTWDQMPGMLT